MSDNMDEPIGEMESAYKAPTFEEKQIKITAKAFKHAENYGLGPIPNISKIPTRKFLIAYGFLSYYETGEGQGLNVHEAAEILSQLIKDEY